tara:strand:- start:1103 stop:1576 length:474 start_codon:yes stop_codon:yes gene_type:complete
MDSYNNIIDLPFDFRQLEYQRLPDFNFDYKNKSLLGEMYNDKIDDGKHDLSHLNIKGWKNFAWCFYRLSPGRWVPPHKDHYVNYSKFYNVSDKNKIYRTLLFLEDWKPGHVFGLDKQVILGWNANDSYTWEADTEHWGGNFGKDLRYTLQLTGTDDS